MSVWLLILSAVEDVEVLHYKMFGNHPADLSSGKDDGQINDCECGTADLPSGKNDGQMNDDGGCTADPSSGKDNCQMNDGEGCTSHLSSGRDNVQMNGDGGCTADPSSGKDDGQRNYEDGADDLSSGKDDGQLNDGEGCTDNLSSGKDNGQVNGDGGCTDDLSSGKDDGQMNYDGGCTDDLSSQKDNGQMNDGGDELEANETERQPAQLPSLDHSQYELNGLCLVLPRIVEHFLVVLECKVDNIRTQTIVFSIEQKKMNCLDKVFVFKGGFQKLRQRMSDQIKKLTEDGATIVNDELKNIVVKIKKMETGYSGQAGNHSKDKEFIFKKGT
ncbi:unnamed protein product [Mytilus coruscus]|uniref:Uncharacterized protein n=1 Tax=Mytilus coruscus TaxID=42192 RepID=A0A6J8B926_MYTCO|nr:unnamed protein product [Mytilus coruscus]